MTLWLLHLPLDRVVWVRALAGDTDCVLGQDTSLSQCLSPPRCINGGLSLHATETGVVSYADLPYLTDFIVDPFASLALFFKL